MTKRHSVSRRPAPWLAVIVLAMGSSACGAVGYSVNMLGATGMVEEAQQSGAEDAAPYEYFYAQAMLNKAREEAGEAEYQTAMEYASIAHEYGERARNLARRRGHESGR